jgi:hypothetical protein
MDNLDWIDAMTRSPAVPAPDVVATAPLRVLLPLLGLLAVSVPAAGQEAPGAAAPPSDTTPGMGRTNPNLAPSYQGVSFLFASRPAESEYELLAFLGRNYLHGDKGQWMTRFGLGAGATLYGSTKDGGLMVGLQAALARVWTGDYLDFFKDTPTEFYAVVGGAAYHIWAPPEAPERDVFVPAVNVGAGVRFRSGSEIGPMVTLELLHEERIGEEWRPRLYVRLGIDGPRRGRTPPSPEPKPAPGTE